MEMSASESNANMDELKLKKPSNSAFKQQRLPAWQPILTAGTVLPTFFVIGILFIPVGIGLWFFSDNVREITIPYTDCQSIEKPDKTCDQVIQENKLADCNCLVPFTINTNFQNKVYIYYALTNFYQNHRRYVKSRDDNQLWGEIGSPGVPVDPSSDCAPFDRDNGKIIYPCGAIANSMFNDEIVLMDAKGKLVPLLNKGIAWDSDRRFKFKNPHDFSASSPMWQHYTKPRDWKKNLWELDSKDPTNNGVENEDFIVWMRTAALPNFRKLYRIIDYNADGFRGGLQFGNYTLKIKYNYEVESFHGTKSIIISTTSLLGGKNPFLGIAYIVVGTICLVLGIVFLFVHINYGKSTWEMTNVDSRTPY